MENRKRLLEAGVLDKIGEGASPPGLNPGAAIPHARESLYYDIAAWILTGLALVFVVKMRLLPALFAGLLVYELVHILAPLLPLKRLSDIRAKMVAVALLAVVSVGLVTLLILGLVVFLRDTGSVPLLLKKMAEILEGSRAMLPPWVLEHLPADPEGMKSVAVEWLREHAHDLQRAGKNAGRVAVHILIGMIIGAMISLREAIPVHQTRPLASALVERAAHLGASFRRVVFAQVRIAALNAFFTWLYLGVALPMFGVDLPLTKTLVAVTFLAGLLPVIGNLISNTVIVVVSLSHSLYIAIASLVFLVVIHKLEYFLNARIIGTQIDARAWELLLAMLAMETAFGLSGVIAAPVYYAYVKDELVSRELV